MSDYDESELSNQSENEQVEEVIEDTPKTGYYKSKKGDADKRKQTSKVNAEKARLAKLAKSAQMKKTEEYDKQFEYEESTDDSSSEGELQITRKKSKAKPPTKKLTSKKQGDPINDRLGKLEEMIAQLATSTAKDKKRVAKKTIIHNHLSAPPRPSATQSKKPFIIDLCD